MPDVDWTFEWNWVTCAIQPLNRLCINVPSITSMESLDCKFVSHVHSYYNPPRCYSLSIRRPGATLGPGDGDTAVCINQTSVIGIFGRFSHQCVSPYS